MANKVGALGRVYLVDINFSMLQVGRDRVLDAGKSKIITCLQADAEKLPFLDNSFDVLTMAFGLRNVTAKKTALAEMYRVLKPGGSALILEFSELQLQSLRGLYDAYSFRVIPKLGKLITKDESSYKYLVESIRRHPKQEELKLWFYEAGFDSCEVVNLTAGVVAIHHGVKY